MDKNAIKKYAVWARNELIARVTQKAEQYEITEKKTTPAEADSIGGRLLSEAEKKQRAALIEKIKSDGFEQVMEEVAYTWFNRFTALRFMEVNNYLPSHTRVFTNEAGEFKPQILTDAIQLELEGLNMDKVFELKEANKTEELYKYLLITQCNALSSVLPRMFQKIAHYTELLLPDYLLREGSVIEQMIALIPEEDWTDQVQIIGWLYQYYNSEPKDAVFAALKKNVKISKENIPAATQLFTPDWIVRYMVENSLGRLWLEGHPNDALKSEWKYYLDEADQEADVQKQLDEIRKEYAELKPEEIRCIDPCMGSGHILCYMFDVLVKIYEDYGYTAREAVGNIVEKNLWGLDIDERAAQLSYFAVMMKARQYDRRFLTREIQPHVYAIEESNGITSAPMHDMGIELSQEEYGKAVKQAMRLVEEMHDAKEYGSLVNVTPCDWGLLRRFAVPRCVSEGQLTLDIHGEIAASERLQVLINIGEALSQKYDATVTNPPYMNLRSGNNRINEFVKKNYPVSKSDLFAVFIERCGNMAKQNGYYALITQQTWMFLSSYEKLRNNVRNNDLINMAHLGARAFEEIAGEVVQTASFVMRKSKTNNYSGAYARLVDANTQDTKEKLFLKKETVYYAKVEDYSNIPGQPIAYWVDHHVFDAFKKYKSLSQICDVKNGMSTTDNNRFTRLWFECDFDNIGLNCQNAIEAENSGKKWFPYNKGGEFRKWYGNIAVVVNWKNNGAEIKKAAEGATGGRIVSQDFYFMQSASWSKVSSNSFALRLYPCGFLFDVAGPGIFANKNRQLYVLALLNSKLNECFLKELYPTMNYEMGQISAFPVNLSENIEQEIDQLAEDSVRLVKEDWDSFELSWDFKRHPLIRNTDTIEAAYAEWENESNDRFQKLYKNEERINELFISLYGLEGRIDPKPEEKEISIRKADRVRDIKSFISYAVGCMFGRYSLDEEGLIFTGGEFDPSRYSTFKADADNIIPVCDDEYFADDIVGLFVKFVKCVYGSEKLEENLKYIAETLGGKQSPREVIRDYFINNFYSDHCANYSYGIYGKRPIYWLFDSGKKNGFKCLVYMNRYRSDTIARIRTDYVHEQQSRYRTALADLEQRAGSSTTADRVKINKMLQILQDQSIEIREYEEKIHHLADQMIAIELDDGIKANYSKFQDVLAKIK